MQGLIRTPVARVFAPGSIGNIGPGLDVLGLAFAERGDEVTARYIDQPGVYIADSGHPDLSTDVAQHTAGIAASEVLRLANATSVGIELTVQKGLPLSGGQGGSAASGVAAAVAVNALLSNPLTTQQLLQACLTAESTVAGRHLDNIGPSLLGGCTLVRSVDEYDVVRIPVPSDLHIVLVHPHQKMATTEGRSVLPTDVPLQVSIAQMAHTSALVTGLMLGDYELIRRSINDCIAEPARAPLLRGFLAAKEAALRAGAYGCSISGSGPTAFALVRQLEHGHAVADVMAQAYRAEGVNSDVYITAVDHRGACVIS